MSLNLPEKVAAFLKPRAGQKFTTREIAEWIFENYKDECRALQERSTAIVNPLDTDKAVVQQVIANISSQYRNLEKKRKIKRTEDRPRKYYYTESTDIQEVEQAENILPSTAIASGKPHVTEHDLYPMLAEFLSSEYQIYSKRIDEKQSSNSHGPKGNQWLYPDLVGMENLSQDWDEEIKKCVQQYSDKKTKLWSFEVKILINRSNIREVFFQAVSNSSWANFGYLVASGLEGSDTLKELQILSSLHGIGFIKLDIDTPSNSQVIIPAKENIDVDWNTANRLAEASTDFLNYIIQVRQFYQTGEVGKTDWYEHSTED